MRPQSLCQTSRAPRRNENSCLHQANKKRHAASRAAEGSVTMPLSLTLADLGSVCERVLHAMPDMRWNFDTVSAWPRHERNLMRPYFAPHRGNGVAEGGDGFGIPRGGSDLELA